MTDKRPAPSAASAKPKPTTWISDGNMLETPPLSARASRFVDNAYNFFGLYFTSLFSLDQYAAAQNSQFNTRGPGRTSNQARSTWGAGTGGNGNVNAPRGGGGGGGGGGRRIGTIDSVRSDGPVMPGPRACGGGSCG